MSSNRRGRRFWINAWWPVAAGLAVIALESTKLFGANNTSYPLRFLFEKLIGKISDARWEAVHVVIRKSGHFLGYGGLGLTWLRAWWMTLPKMKYLPDAGLALLATAVVASCDEWHQTFLPNRTGAPRDVLIDCSGALAMFALVFLYRLLFHRDRAAGESASKS
jgi:VanZ family protein